MPLYSQKGSLGNILARKAFRHSRIATLYPNLGAGSSFDRSPRTRNRWGASSPTSRLVQATLALPSPAVPTVETIPTNSAFDYSTQTAAQAAPRSVPPQTQTAKPVETPVHRPVPQTEPAEPAPLPTPRYESGSGLDDITWRRLQAIYRKHQEIAGQQGEGTTGETAAGEAAPAVPQTLSQPSSTAQRNQGNIQKEKPGSHSSPRTDEVVAAKPAAAGLQDKISAHPARQEIINRVPGQAGEPSRIEPVRRAPSASEPVSPRRDSAMIDDDRRIPQAIYRKYQEKAQQENSAPQVEVSHVSESERQNPQAASEFIQANPVDARREAALPEANKDQEAAIPSEELSDTQQFDQPVIQTEAAPAVKPAQPSQAVPVLQRVRDFFRKRPEKVIHSDVPQQPASELLRENRPKPSSTPIPASSPIQTARLPEAKISGPKKPQTESGLHEVQSAHTTAVYEPSISATQDHAPLPQSQDTDFSEMVQRKAEAKEIKSTATYPVVSIPFEGGEVFPIRSPEYDEQNDASELPTQALPLQAIWSVENREFSPGISSVPSATEDEIQFEPVNSADSTEIQRLMASVQPGQPTDSSVEVISPRKPRPPVPSPIRIPQVGEPASQPENQVIQTQSSDESFEIHTTPIQAERPKMVNTPAGPLPEELLKRITEPAESDTPYSSYSGEDDQPAIIGAPQPPFMWRRTSAAPPASLSVAQSLKPAEVPEPSRIEPSLIQRVEAPAEDATGAQAETETAAGNEQPDVDELARKVYAEVKRKLMVEWERMRR